MAEESFATGAGLSGALQTVWTNNISGGVSRALINDPDQRKVDILRGWPIEGAISDFFAMEDPVDPIAFGQFVQFSATGKMELADSPDLVVAAPIKIMLALDANTSTTVQESQKLPVLMSNYVVRTDALDAGSTVADFAFGAPVAVIAGNLTHDVSPAAEELQVVGYVVGKDTALGTVDIEVAR